MCSALQLPSELSLPEILKNIACSSYVNENIWITEDVLNVYEYVLWEKII
jgi:hypothetical protein